MVVKVDHILKNFFTIKELIKTSLSISWSHTKIFIHSLFAHILPVSLEYLATVFAIILSDKLGLLKAVGVSVEEMVFTYLIYYFFTEICAVVDWKNKISNMLESEELSWYLIKPKHPLLLDSLFVDHGYWLQTFIFYFLWFLITLIYYKISLINLIKALFVFLISLVFVYSTSVFVRSLDFIIKGLTSLSYTFKYHMSDYFKAYSPKYYEKLNKPLFYLLFVLNSYFVSFFTVVPALVKGVIYYKFLVFFLLISTILIFLTKKIWEFGIKKYKAYL